MNVAGASNAYVTARRALLDGLDALHDHLDAVILVGAQAIYLYTGEADVAIATQTKDGDLAIDPELLEAEPRLEEAMTAAGFRLHPQNPQPGVWYGESGVAVDLLVPDALGGGGGRGARIPPHDKFAARKVHGLEAAIIDNELQEVASLTPETDSRTFQIRVAGPTALLIAKMHKIGERAEQPDRLVDKDAHDIYRLLRAVETDVFAEKIVVLRDDKLAGPVTRRAIDYLQTLFAEPTSVGSVMAGRTERVVGDPDQVATAVSALAAELLDGV